MITFLKGIGVDYDQLLKNNNLVNNISLMEIFKKIYYSWKTFKTFNDIKISYQNAQQRGKLSSLKNKLEIKDAVEVLRTFHIFTLCQAWANLHYCKLSSIKQS